MKRPPDFAPIIYNATISHQWNCSIIIYSTAYIVPYAICYTQLEWPQLVYMKRCCTVTSSGYLLAMKCYHLKGAAVLAAWGWIRISWICCPHFSESFCSIWAVLRGMTSSGGCFHFQLEEERNAALTQRKAVPVQVGDMKWPTFIAGESDHIQPNL